MTYSGQCMCGAVRYDLAGEPNRVAACHCGNCRRAVVYTRRSRGAATGSADTNRRATSLNEAAT
jgi:hypothetical protein